MSSCLSILILALLLAFPALAVEGASAGLLLWFNVVLPTLAPFMICTKMVSVFGAEELLIRPVYPLIHCLFGYSREGAYVLFCGLLCGYPLGAKLCAEKKSKGMLVPAEAKCLLAVSNHPSPMFLLGFVNRQLAALSIPGFSPYLILLSLYLPILPISVLAKRIYRVSTIQNQTQNCLSGRAESIDSESIKSEQIKSESIEDAIFSTAHTMVLIGGWIMLFSILARWIQTIPVLSIKEKAVFGGIAEITTGIPLICSAFSDEKKLCMILTVVCAAFGGCSGISQTRSVLIEKNAGLSIRHYILWKAVHALLAAGILIFLL